VFLLGLASSLIEILNTGQCFAVILENVEEHKNGGHLKVVLGREDQELLNKNN
jgi:hypothetical protein